MNILQTNPRDGEVVSSLDRIVVTFDKNIDVNSFTTQMASIFDEDGNTLTYTYEISGSDLILIPQTLNAGKTYRVFISGVDIFTNTNLQQTDGDTFSGQIEFTFKLEQQPLPEINVIDISADDVYIIQSSKYILNTNVFYVKFSDQILTQQVECFVTTENFNGIIQYDRYIIAKQGETVLDNDQIVQYGISGDTITIQFDYFQPNCIITLELPSITFENGLTKSYTFTLATQLSPYFNVSLLKTKFGDQKEFINDTDVYLQLYETIIKAEELFSKPILGQNIILPPEIRLFVNEYQYWSLYEILIMQKALRQGDRLTTANTTIVNGDVDSKLLDYIRKQKDNVVTKYTRLKAQVQMRGSQMPTMHFERARRYINRLKEVWWFDK